MEKKDNKSTFWGSFKAALFSYLKVMFSKEKLLKIIGEKAVKVILKKLVIVGGWKAWLIAWVVGELVEEVDEHLIEPAFRKVGYVADSLKGKKIYKRIENAQDVDDWRASIGDV